MTKDQKIAVAHFVKHGDHRCRKCIAGFRAYTPTRTTNPEGSA